MDNTTSFLNKMKKLRYAYMGTVLTWRSKQKGIMKFAFVDVHISNDNTHSNNVL